MRAVQDESASPAVGSEHGGNPSAGDEPASDGSPDAPGTVGPAVAADVDRPACRNCGAALAGRFCAQCGQAADTRIPSLRELLGEYVDGAFNLDSRLWQTLGPLAMQPGRLTLEFFAGRRARYVAPFRLYLVLSLVFFVVSSATDTPAAPSTGPLLLEPASDAPESAPEDTCRDFLGATTPAGFLHDRLLQSCTRIVADRGRQLGRDLANRVPLVVFLCVPLTAGVLKLFYAFSRRRYVEHLYFLLHAHAMFFLLLTVTSLLAWSGGLFPPLATVTGPLRFALWLYLIAYGYIALRKVYRQGRAVTAIKYVTFAASYAVMLGVVFASALVFTALTL